MLKNIEIVSLSRGVLGESFVKHELDIGLKRLKELNLNVKFSKHALMGLDYLDKHPEKRAEDLLEAFKDDGVDMILCAIGGDDTYRLLPYLFSNDELKRVVNRKVFLGFSDTTINHFMLHKVSLDTFYGQAFLSDICDIGKDMYSYTRKYFEELINTETISSITPSPLWYEARTSFSVQDIGSETKAHKNEGFKLLQGKDNFEGKILGGCLDSIYDFFDGERYKDMPILCNKYGLFPDIDDWKGKILLLETSEEKMSKEKYKKALLYLKQTGIFEVISGILIGKPVDEYNTDAYLKCLNEVIDNKGLPIVYNLNIGHNTPRAIIPFGKKALVSVDKQIIKFEE